MQSLQSEISNLKNEIDTNRSTHIEIKGDGQKKLNQLID
jgi:chromosome segregation ATPase